MGLLHHQRGETYGFQMTDAELEAVQKYKNLPEQAVEILRREGAGGVHTQAFIKLYHRMRIERLIHEEALRLVLLKEKLASLNQAVETINVKDEKIEVLEAAVIDLERELVKVRNNHVKELAAPAMAVDAAPTGR